jgi:transposase-like protein
MSKFPEKVRKILESSPFVQKVTGSQVLFTSEFKIKAVELNLEGASPQDIFNRLGIDTALFLPDFPKKSVSRWRKIYETLGEEGLKEERRGRGSTGRPKRSFDPSNPASLLERIAYLEAENYILKKLEALAAKHEKKKGSK